MYLFSSYGKGRGVVGASKAVGECSVGKRGSDHREWFLLPSLPVARMARCACLKTSLVSRLYETQEGRRTGLETGRVLLRVR